MSNRKATPIGILTITALTTLMIAAPSAAAQVAADFSPGSEIKNRTASKNCTAGWTGSIDGKEGFLTSGHCGSVGDVFYDSNGALIGTMTHDMDSDLFDSEGNPKYTVDVEGDPKLDGRLSDATTDIAFIEFDPDVDSSPLPIGIPSGSAVKDSLSIEQLDNAGRLVVGKSGKNTGQTHSPYDHAVSDKYFRVDSDDEFAISGDSGSPMYVYSKDKSSVFPVGTLSGSSDLSNPVDGRMIKGLGATMNYPVNSWGFEASTTS